MAANGKHIVTSKRSKEIIDKLPKILLHTHLEGSISEQILLKLCKCNKIKLPFPVKSSIIKNMCCSGGWDTFLSIFLAISSCFKTQQDFRDAVVDYACRLAEQKVVYAELHCSPWNHISNGVDLDEIGSGLLSGIEIAKKKYGVSLKIILDLIRDPAEDVYRILDWVGSLPRVYFVAIGISGGANSLPLEKFGTYCQQAKELGLKVVAHAGELDGPDSVRVAVKCLRVDRICHGINVLKDPSLLGELILEGIHFELCPTSNQVLFVGKPHHLSIREILASGAQCSINTDDELLFDTYLTKEFLVLKKNSALELPDFLRLQQNAIIAAFTDVSERNQIMVDLITAWQKLTNDLI